nr:histidine utilization repressor-like [Nerophis lumbriciformis]
MTKSAAAKTEICGIEKKSVLPLYQQIKSDIRNKIDRDEWLPGERLPSENTLVKRLGVSRMTIHRALRELTGEGLLERVHGLGTFVATPPRHASLIRLQDIAEEVRSINSVYSCKDSVAIQLEDRLINPAFFRGFETTDFTERTATDYLMHQFKPDEMEHIVRATLADKTTARVLEIDIGEPCIQLTRRTWKQHGIVTRVVLTYPSSRYDLQERYRTSDIPTSTI